MSSLNAAQSAAVEHHRGPLLVLAGAGSGKTRVITQRIARLVERGVRPEAILAVSFTNKAAAEMAERMVPLVGERIAARLWLSTFHSFGVRFLGEENRALGYDGRFVIFDQGDALGLVKEIVKRQTRGERALDTSAILSRISLWKNAFLAPDEVKESAFEYDDVARRVYPEYEKALRTMHAVDFDDLVVVPVRLLRDREDLREKWQRRFSHLLIDEFQDTNKSQLELVRQLASAERNVCVVGDDDQSIYAWRGAEVGNILEFEKHFAGATVVKLEENYRSRRPILEVANAAIAQSKGKRHDKRLVPTRGGEDPVRIVSAYDAIAEARFVAREIRRLTREEAVRLDDCAVLYRSNLLARTIEEELRAEGIPYRLFGGTQFFDRKEIKDAVAYVRLAVMPEDELSLRRVVNHPPRGLGDTSIERLEAHATRVGRPLAKVLREARDITGLPDVGRRGAEELVAAVDRARDRYARGESLVVATRALLEDAGLYAHLTHADGKDGERRRDNLEFFLRSLERHERQYGTDPSALVQFTNRLSLRFESGDAEEEGRKVTLSSLHSAKGLEFPYVFLIGCVEGYLPHARTTDPKITEASPTDVEEERRLFYVGVTRARERLYLSYPNKRTARGRVAPHVPSRFLDGLPEAYTKAMTPEHERPLDHAGTASAASAILAMLAGKK